MKFRVVLPNKGYENYSDNSYRVSDGGVLFIYDDPNEVKNRHYMDPTPPAQARKTYAPSAWHYVVVIDE